LKYDDDNENIQFDQFIEIMNCEMSESEIENENESEIIDEFGVFDKDGDGKITAAELTHIMKNLGEPLTQEEVDEMIAQADTNKDGIIDYAEFVHLLNC
jgi:calmodulin